MRGVHTWSYCEDCERWMVLCGNCGNNTCNGGYGTVLNPLTGVASDCPDCPSAYELDDKGVPDGM